jgi:hypothetical protein
MASKRKSKKISTQLSKSNSKSKSQNSPFEEIARHSFNFSAIELQTYTSRLTFRRLHDYEIIELKEQYTNGKKFLGETCEFDIFLLDNNDSMWLIRDENIPNSKLYLGAVYISYTHLIQINNETLTSWFITSRCSFNRTQAINESSYFFGDHKITNGRLLWAYILNYVNTGSRHLGYTNFLIWNQTTEDARDYHERMSMKPFSNSASGVTYGHKLGSNVLQELKTRLTIYDSEVYNYLYYISNNQSINDPYYDRIENIYLGVIKPPNFTTKKGKIKFG